MSDSNPTFPTPPPSPKLDYCSPAVDTALRLRQAKRINALGFLSLIAGMGCYATYICIALAPFTPQHSNVVIYGIIISAFCLLLASSLAAVSIYHIHDLPEGLKCRYSSWIILLISFPSFVLLLSISFVKV